MKSIPLLTLAAIPCLIWGAMADEPDKKKAVTEVDDPFSEAAEAERARPAPCGVGLIFEWIELDHRAANKLIRKHATQIRADKLRDVLEKMLDEKKAELVETAYLVSTKNQRARVESVDEHIYPTEYDAPEIPQKIHKDIPLDQIPVSPANPTAFETRNVGTNVEAEAVISPSGDVIDLNLAPEIVQHLGNRTIGDPKTLHAALAHVYQPDFYVMKIQTNLALHNGSHTLVSLFTPAGKKDKRVMLLVRANVLY